MRGRPEAEDPEIVRLVAAAANGDRVAFGLLLPKVHVRIVSACSVDGIDRSSMDDVLQEAVFAIWRGLPGFRQEARFTTWMHTVAHNAALRWLEKNARHRMTATPDPDQERASDVIEFPELHAQSDRLAAALSRLPDRERASLLLALEGVPLQEIAQQFFASVGTVKSWNARSRQDLRRFLASDGS